MRKYHKTTLGRDCGLWPNLISARSIVLVIILCSYVVFSYYNSVLTSWMTSGPAAATIKSFQDVIDGDYQVGIVEIMYAS